MHLLLSGLDCPRAKRLVYVRSEEYTVPKDEIWMNVFRSPFHAPGMGDATG